MAAIGNKNRIIINHFNNLNNNDKSIIKYSQIFLWK